MTGHDIREYRMKIGLSQAKLSLLSGIVQARISAFEIGKRALSSSEILSVVNQLESLDESGLTLLKKKRTQKKQAKGFVVIKKERRKYHPTKRNREYLGVLKDLESKFEKPANTGLKAISFFAGCGGLCYGVKAAGFRIVATNELVENYKSIYKLNFQEVHFLPDDIRDVSNNHIRDILKQHGPVDLVVGGPPCQGFSLTGKRDVNDQRNTLFEHYLRIAENIQPKIILMENVRLLTSMKDAGGQLVIERILSTFRKIGYKASFFTINAKKYGVPQHRERVIFIAVRTDLNQQPEITAGKYSNLKNGLHSALPCFTFGDAVSDLEYLESGENSSRDKFHRAVAHPQHVIRWLVDVREGASAHNNEDPAMRPPSGYNTTYKRQVWNEPAATVATTFGMISGSSNVHPVATRALTIREALRLQSFPDSFKLRGNNGTIRTVIGNSVPPLLAFELADFIRTRYFPIL